jgi:hypothetical protein
VNVNSQGDVALRHSIDAGGSWDSVTELFSQEYGGAMISMWGPAASDGAYVIATLQSATESTCNLLVRRGLSIDSWSVATTIASQVKRHAPKLLGPDEAGRIYCIYVMDDGTLAQMYSDDAGESWT